MPDWKPAEPEAEPAVDASPGGMDVLAATSPEPDAQAALAAASPEPVADVAPEKPKKRRYTRRQQQQRPDEDQAKDAAGADEPEGAERAPLTKIPAKHRKFQKGL